MTYKGNVVVDAVSHAYNWTEDNCTNEIAEGISQELYQFSTHLTPEEYEMPEELWFENRTAEELAHVLFEESDIDFTVYHNAPIFDFFEDGGSGLEKGIEMRDAYPNRVAVLGGVNPLRDGWEKEMERQVKDLKVDGIKLYPSDFRDGKTLNVRLNEKDSALPLVKKADDMGVDLIAVHKALPIGPSSQENLGVDDIEEIAPQFPDINFEIVHAGFSFLEETSLALRHPNVWADFEITQNFVTAKPRRFAEILGELMFWGGPDSIMFATGSTFTHPQPLIEALWDFQIPEDMQENYGYPPLTDEIKAKLLGRNALDLLGLDAEEVLADVEDDKWDQARTDEKPEPWSTIA